MSINTTMEHNYDIKETIFNAVKSKKQREGDKGLLPVFDSSQFPTINVTFSTMLDRPAFDCFLKQWLDCYSQKEDFTFIFNMQNIKWVSPSYSLIVIKFMKQLRKHIRELPYLKTSIMIINSNFIRGLLYRVFQIQAPISHVYLVSSKEEAEKIAQGDEIAKKYSVNIPPNTLLK